MRSYDSATLAYLQSRGAIVARILVLITARDRTTGSPQIMAIWNGEESRSFTVNGVARTFIGAGSLMKVPQIVTQAGLDVRIHRWNLSPINEAVATAIRAYDPRFAPFEAWRVLFDPVTGAQVAPPHRIAVGMIDDVNVTTPEAGGEASAELSIASSSRRLTRTLPTTRSDESQRRRDTADRFFRYVDVSGVVDVWWGEKRA